MLENVSFFTNPIRGAESRCCFFLLSKLLDFNLVSLCETKKDRKDLLELELVASSLSLSPRDADEFAETVGKI